MPQKIQKSQELLKLLNLKKLLVTLKIPKNDRLQKTSKIIKKISLFRFFPKGKHFHIRVLWFGGFHKEEFLWNAIGVVFVGQSNQTPNIFSSSMAKK
jgi:hypothetical protein